MSNFIKCYACNKASCSLYKSPQTHFLLRMYDGEEISICMLFSLLINYKLQIFSLIFKQDIFTLASS